MNAKEEKFKCMECGSEEEFLFSLSKNNHRGQDFWVCDKCFIKIEEVSFEDYKADDE